MNSPSKFARKPQLYLKSFERINRLRCRSDEIAQICYISPKKKQKSELNIGPILQSVVDIKTMRIIQENQQLKMIISELSAQNSLIKQQINKLRNQQEHRNLQKSKEKILQLSTDNKSFDLEDTSKHTPIVENRSHNFSFKKEKSNANQCQQQINIIKIESLKKALKQANKTIAKLKTQLNSALINQQISQHRLIVKERMLTKIKQRECQKIFKEVSQGNTQSHQSYFYHTSGSKISNIFKEDNQKQNINLLKNYSSSNFNQSNYKPFSFIEYKSGINSTMSDLKSLIEK